MLLLDLLYVLTFYKTHTHIYIYIYIYMGVCVIMTCCKTLFNNVKLI